MCLDLGKGTPSNEIPTVLSRFVKWPTTETDKKLILSKEEVKENLDSGSSKANDESLNDKTVEDVRRLNQKSFDKVLRRLDNYVLNHYAGITALTMESQQYLMQLRIVRNDSRQCTMKWNPMSWSVWNLETYGSRISTDYNVRCNTLLYCERQILDVEHFLLECPAIHKNLTWCSRIKTWSAVQNAGRIIEKW